jgi:hypothetical protein
MSIQAEIKLFDDEKKVSRPALGLGAAERSTLLRLEEWVEANHPGAARSRPGQIRH